MFTLTRTKPDGTVHTYEAQTIKKAGQQIAYWIDDNNYAPRKEATRLAMQAEQERTLTYRDNTWTITKATRSTAR